MTTTVFRIAASHEELQRVGNAIEEMGPREQWPARVLFKVKLVVEELGLNIIKHGYRNDDSKEIEIRLSSVDGAITIEFIDEARAFDPFTETPVPDMSGGLEERPVGGLGVHLVRQVMDEVSYARAGNRNHSTLVTRLAQ